MTPVLDTSVLVRYLSGDPPELAERARALIESGCELLLSSVAISETSYVLTKVYMMPRDDVLEVLIHFVQRLNIRTSDADKSLTIQGLEFCRGSGRVSCADALMWATARATQTAGGPPARVYTFDRRFPADEIEVVAP